MRLADRLTLVLLAPLLIRIAVQVPLYLAEEVGWLGLTRLALGWPLHAATLAVALLILLRGNTPMPGPEQDHGDGLGPRRTGTDPTTPPHSPKSADS